MSTIDLLAKVRNLKELEALISEAQAELDSIKDELKAEMTTAIQRSLTLMCSRSGTRQLSPIALTQRHLRALTKTCTTNILSRPKAAVSRSHKRKEPYITAVAKQYVKALNHLPEQDLHLL